MKRICYWNHWTRVSCMVCIFRNINLTREIPVLTFPSIPEGVMRTHPICKNTYPGIAGTIFDLPQIYKYSPPPPPPPPPSRLPFNHWLTMAGHNANLLVLSDQGEPLFGHGGHWTNPYQTHYLSLTMAATAGKWKISIFRRSARHVTMAKTRVPEIIGSNLEFFKYAREY